MRVGHRVLEALVFCTLCPQVEDGTLFLEWAGAESATHLSLGFPRIVLQVFLSYLFLLNFGLHVFS